MTLLKLVHLVEGCEVDEEDEDAEEDTDNGNDSLDSGRAVSPLRTMAKMGSFLGRCFRWRQDTGANADTDSDPGGTEGGQRNAGRKTRKEKMMAMMKQPQKTKTKGKQWKNKPSPQRRGSKGQGRGPILADGSQLEETSMLRSLQRFHASGNEARADFMEKHSSLAPLGMAVSAEQVSIFLTNDNTVISFFEVSAGDVERPIARRLDTAGTIVRQSCDASLLVQAIIDAIIDLALPLTAVYNDLLGDMELDVLTAPSMGQSRGLYICVSEINKMLRFLHPIDNLVNVLRDHRAPMSQDEAARALEDPSTGVIVTPMTHTYLGDVLDHCIITTEALQQLKQSSENLISLIFNTITANQNESMKQLTIVTIIFLPLTFITGFFGQNFEAFPEIHHGIWYL